MDKYLFYPGCSMESSAKAYYESLMAICGPLGLNLEEIDDWNCCGATEYLGVSLTPAYALIARNLALAVQSGQRHPHRGCAVQRLLPEPGQVRLLHAGTTGAG